MDEPKAPRVQHDTPTKNRIVGAYQAGATMAEAGRLNSVPSRTAQYIINRFLKHNTTKNLPRPGAPKKATDRTHRFIIRTAKKNRRMPFAEIGNLVEPQLSASTIHRELAEEGYHQCKAKRVPYLRKATIVKRKRHAARFRDWTRGDFEPIIFSDECYVYLGGNKGSVFVTRTPHERYHEECTVPAFTQSPLRVMVWGCIMWNAKGPLVVLEYPGGKGGGMNTEWYIAQVLEGTLLDFIRKQSRTIDNIRFQQDGAPSHTSKKTKRWFADHSISLFPHPPSSPDLNPIEPVWFELKTLIGRRAHPPTSIHELIQAVHEAWDEIDVETINKYIGSMPERVAAVIDAQGRNTKY